MGSKSSKRLASGGAPLSREMIDELCQDTGFTEEELQAWHTNFYKDCPDGKLTLKQFEQEYAKIMGKPTQKTADYVRHMFNVYDHDKNQFIDFKEFVMALSAASVVNRLRLIETLFHVFDLDNDGKITKEEIGKMLHTLVDVTNANDKRRRQHHSAPQERTQQINVQKRIDDAFNELNANDDDHITKDEFIEWYMKSGLISDVQTNEINLSDTSRIQQLEKKSRKLIKQSSNMKTSNEHEEHRHRAPLVRHMSRMTERKSAARYEDDDDDDDDNNTLTTSYNNNNNPTTVSSVRNSRIDDERTIIKPSIRITTTSDDNESYSSKENERWQHLFNSVLGQIRTQRQKEQQQQQPTTNVNEQNHRNNFNSWKREGEEKIKSEYMKQKTTTEQNRSPLLPKTKVVQSSTTTTTSDELPPSPDVISIRF